MEARFLAALSRNAKPALANCSESKAALAAGAARTTTKRDRSSLGDERAPWLILAQ